LHAQQFHAQQFHAQLDGVWSMASAWDAEAMPGQARNIIAIPITAW